MASHYVEKPTRDLWRTRDVPAALVRQDVIPFPLYHGTSNHYQSAFQRGTSPTSWPHRDAAFSLFSDVCAALCASGVKPEWYETRVLNQENGHNNWQHGDLYVTPSRYTAVKYAASNARFGGELLTMCKDALDRLNQFDPAGASSVFGDAGSLVRLLRGNGAPILIEFDNVCADDLLPERVRDNVSKKVSELVELDDEKRELFGQQTNFRLKSGRGTVARVFGIKVEGPTDPLRRYELSEIDF